MSKDQLVLSLASYVSEDDVTLSRADFLRFVADRINDDIENAVELVDEMDAVYDSEPPLLDGIELMD
jgi:hypothetical protein